ncbi:MAG: glycosyltransferase [Chloroflexi bacterium]|nr:MAG: glycosyltransferase [Chloroflexota bacterium]
MAQDPAAAPLALSIVVPVYNEAENIAPVLRNLAGAVKATPYEVLIVYDFDADTTVPVVQRLVPEMPQLRLQRNDLGRGVLNAIRKGFQVAKAPSVLVMMADGSDEPQAIDEMLRRARAGADVVAGSRYVRGGGQEGGPLLKRTLSRTAGLSLHWLGRLPIHDATSNFRMYSRRLLDAVTIESSAGFELALELTVKAQRLGMKVDEVPTVWHDRTAGTSRFRLWQWMPHYLRWYWVAFGFGRSAARPAASAQPPTQSGSSADK